MSLASSVYLSEEPHSHLRQAQQHHLSVGLPLGIHGSMRVRAMHFAFHLREKIATKVPSQEAYLITYEV